MHAATHKGEKNYLISMHGFGLVIKQFSLHIHYLAFKLKKIKMGKT